MNKRPQSANPKCTRGKLDDFEVTTKSLILNNSNAEAIKKKVVENIIKGKKIDAMTLEYRRASQPECKSTYVSEVGNKVIKRAPSPSATNEKKNHNSEKPGTEVNRRPRSVLNQRSCLQLQEVERNIASNRNSVENCQDFEGDDHIKQTLSMFKYGPNDPITKTIQENAEYFSHISGLCHCKECKCGKHKCKQTSLHLKARPMSSSIYAKDFVPYPGNEKAAPIKYNLSNTFHSNAPMDFGTTHKNDFKQWKPDPAKKIEDVRNIHTVPFMGKSAYQSEFLDWGNNGPNLGRPINFKTVIPELPFFGNTTYNSAFACADDFNGDQSPYKTPVKPIKPKPNKSPMSPGISFIGESMAMKDYKPFKIASNPYKRRKEEYEPTEALPNQYLSHYKKEYSRKNSFNDSGDCPVPELRKRHL